MLGPQLTIIRFVIIDTQHRRIHAISPHGIPYRIGRESHPEHLVVLFDLFVIRKLQLTINRFVKINTKRRIHAISPHGMVHRTNRESHPAHLVVLHFVSVIHGPQLMISRFVKIDTQH